MIMILIKASFAFRILLYHLISHIHKYIYIYIYTLHLAQSPPTHVPLFTLLIRFTQPFRPRSQPIEKVRSKNLITQNLKVTIDMRKWKEEKSPEQGPIELATTWLILGGEEEWISFLALNFFSICLYIEEIKKREN
jgi:hypothetical protein